MQDSIFLEFPVSCPVHSAFENLFFNFFKIKHFKHWWFDWSFKTLFFSIRRIYWIRRNLPSRNVRLCSFFNLIFSFAANRSKCDMSRSYIRKKKVFFNMKKCDFCQFMFKNSSCEENKIKLAISCLISTHSI